MIKSSIEKMANSIGYDIGQSNDETQAYLLNGFCRALKNSMEDNNLNTQLSYIVDRLDLKACEVIKALSEFIMLKEAEK